MKKTFSEKYHLCFAFLVFLVSFLSKHLSLALMDLPDTLTSYSEALIAARLPWTRGMRPRLAVVMVFWVGVVSKRLHIDQLECIAAFMMGSPFPCPIGTCNYGSYKRLRRRGHDSQTILSRLHSKCKTVPKAWSRDQSIPASVVFPTVSAPHYVLVVGPPPSTFPRPEMRCGARQCGFGAPNPPIPLRFARYGTEYPVDEDECRWEESSENGLSDASSSDLALSACCS